MRQHRHRVSGVEDGSTEHCKSLDITFTNVYPEIGEELSVSEKESQHRHDVAATKDEVVGHHSHELSNFFLKRSLACGDQQSCGWVRELFEGI